MRAWLILAGLALALPAAAQPTGCAAHAAALPGLVGLTEAEAVAAIERMPGITLVRFGAPGSPMTQDWRPERATVLLQDGKVVAVRCG